MCNKKQSRVITQLFRIFDCQGCDSYRDDDCILIGKVKIHLYYLHEGCSLEEVEECYYWFLSKLQRLLYDACYLTSHEVLLWIDGWYYLEEYATILELCMGLGENIRIICG